MMDITVVIPTIPERADLLERAVASVDRQILMPDDVIVVPAGPEEDAPVVKNRGLGLVKTKWVAMLDDDDEFTEDHLQCLAKCALDHHADLAYPWFELIDEHGGIVDPQPSLCVISSCVSVGGDISAEGVPWGPELRHLTMTPGGGNVIITGVLMQTDFARRVGGYPLRTDKDWPEYPWEELGLWRRMLFEGATFAHSPKRTYRWHRTHGRNTGGRLDLRKQHYQWMP